LLINKQNGSKILNKTADRQQNSRQNKILVELRWHYKMLSKQEKRYELFEFTLILSKCLKLFSSFIVYLITNKILKP